MQVSWSTVVVIGLGIAAIVALAALKVEPAWIAGVASAVALLGAQLKPILSGKKDGAP